MGNNYVIVSYDFRVAAGDWLLKGIGGEAKKTAEKVVYENEDIRGTIRFDIQNIISITLYSKSGDSGQQKAVTGELPKASFNSTTAGKWLKQLEREKKELLKSKAELEKIKKSNGYKVLKKYYKIREMLFK